MSDHAHKEKHYVRRLFAFYFAPLLRSFVTVLYLLFFLYFGIFYFNNVLLAFKFLFYTLGLAPLSLGLKHLFYGSIFVVLLIIPFSISLYAIALPFEIKKTDWKRPKRLAVIALIALATLDIVFFTNLAVKEIKKTAPITAFLQYEGIVPTK